VDISHAQYIACLNRQVKALVPFDFKFLLRRRFSHPVADMLEELKPTSRCGISAENLHRKGPAMSEVTFRFATTDDIDALVTLRARFLAEVSTADASSPRLLMALRRYFQNALPAGQFAAAVACNGANVVATAGLTYHHHPPTAENLTGLHPYLLNIYTLPEWRRRGLATALIENLLDHLSTAGYARVSLHTFPNARALYKECGFSKVDTEMQCELAASPEADA
jgi:ribosomal protein S18 acetylase RimI-like enzyme